MKRQSGAGLIEVLITALILGGSLMALSALQSRSLQYNHSAYLRSQANLVAYDIADRMRARSTADEMGQVQDDDVEDVLSVLPTGAEADVDACPNRVCTVSVSWPEEDGADEDGETTTFVYRTRI